MDYKNEEFISQLLNILAEAKPDKILFVCSRAYDRYGYRAAMDSAGYKCIAFTAFEPFPEVSSVMNGVEVFGNEHCDFIVAVGGGSALDVAKAIKYYAKSDVQILAVPTTAGTGAEVTRFSVLYNKGDKDSIRSYDIIPDFQVFDYTTLASLPYEQKLVTALDAFCHSVEAYWSTDATNESREYSKRSLALFNENIEKYLKDDSSSYVSMMECSTLAGKAINIAQTCAPHAFSYKLHKLKGFYHGRAVAVCLAYIWKYLADNSEKFGLDKLLSDTCEITGYTADSFIEFLANLGLLKDLEMTSDQFGETVNGVNTDRLKNSPIQFEHSDIEAVYKSFIKQKQ